jgi:hypothetical protein
LKAIGYKIILIVSLVAMLITAATIILSHDLYAKPKWLKKLKREVNQMKEHLNEALKANGSNFTSSPSRTPDLSTSSTSGGQSLKDIGNNLNKLFVK